MHASICFSSVSTRRSVTTGTRVSPKNSKMDEQAWAAAARAPADTIPDKSARFPRPRPSRKNSEWPAVWVTKKDHHSTDPRTQPAPKKPATRRYPGANTQIGPIEARPRERQRHGSAPGKPSDRNRRGGRATTWCSYSSGNARRKVDPRHGARQVRDGGGRNDGPGRLTENARECAQDDDAVLRRYLETTPDRGHVDQ